MTEPNLLGRKRAALRELSGWRVDLEPALTSALPNPPPFTAIEEKLLEILPLMPDPGWRAPTMRAFSVGGAIYVAVYLTVRPLGLDAAAAWSVCEAATKSHFGRMKGIERAAASSMFSWPMRYLVRSLEARSKEAPLGGWAARYVEGEAPADYGVDYSRCAIRELAVDAGASEFAPFICNSDAIGSQEFGWGLHRTETLAQGGKRCDFRFKRGGPTKVRLHVIEDTER